MIQVAGSTLSSDPYAAPSLPNRRPLRLLAVELTVAPVDAEFDPGACALGHLGHELGNEIAYDDFNDVAVEYVRTSPLYCQDLKDRLIDGLRKAGWEG